MNDSLNINQPVESVEASSVSAVEPVPQNVVQDKIEEQHTEVVVPVEKNEVEAVSSAQTERVEEKSSVSSVIMDKPVTVVTNTAEIPQQRKLPKLAARKPELNWDSLYFKVSEPKKATESNENIQVLAVQETGQDTAKSDSAAVDSLAKDSTIIASAVKKVEVKTIPSKEGAERVPTVSMSIWYTPFLLLLFIVYMYVLGARMKAFKTEVLTFFNPNAGGSIFGSEWLQSSPYKFALTCSGLCCLGLFLYFVTNGSDCTLQPLYIFVSVVCALLLCLFKKWLMDMLQFVYFPGRTTLFSNSYLTIIRLTGLCLVPSVLMLSYSPESCFNFAIYLGLGVLIIAKILIISKTIANFFDGFATIFYLFLYLCTLEVLPIAGVCAFLVNIKYIF